MSAWQVSVAPAGAPDGQFSSFSTASFQSAVAVTGRLTSGGTQWIANNASGTNACCVGNWTFFVFRQSFTLTAAEASTANLQFQWAADDSGEGFASRGGWLPKYSLNSGGLVNGVLQVNFKVPQLAAGAHKTNAAVTVYGPSVPTSVTPGVNPVVPVPQPAVQTSYGPFSVTPGVGGDPQTVSVSFALNSSCAGYNLDWGDSSTHQTQTDGGTSCGAVTTTKSFTHQYGGAGSYTITLKRGPSLGSTDTASVVIQ